MPDLTQMHRGAQNGMLTLRENSDTQKTLMFQSRCKSGQPTPHAGPPLLETPSHTTVIPIINPHGVQNF